MDSRVQPKIRFNREFPTASSIQQHNGSSHGLTLMVLSLIDKSNAKLAVELICSGESQMQDIASQIKSILQTSKVVKVYFRSVKNNGVFQPTYDELKLESVDGTPSSPDAYGKYHAILDIETTADSQIWKFYRNPEAMPRTLTILVKP